MSGRPSFAISQGCIAHCAAITLILCQEIGARNQTLRVVFFRDIPRMHCSAVITLFFQEIDTVVVLWEYQSRQCRGLVCHITDIGVGDVCCSNRYSLSQSNFVFHPIVSKFDLPSGLIPMPSHRLVHLDAVDVILRSKSQVFSGSSELLTAAGSSATVGYSCFVVYGLNTPCSIPVSKAISCNPLLMFQPSPDSKRVYGSSS